MTVPPSASLDTPAPALEKASFWDDAIEIFVHPAAVYRRRANSNPWPPIFFVAIVIGVVSYFTFNTLAPGFEADFNRGVAKQMAANPQLTQAAVDKSRDMMMSISRFVIGPSLVFIIFMVGAFSWLISKLFGARTTFTQGLVVGAWAFFPRILGAIVNGIEGLVMDPSSINSTLSISLSPARFMDVETANPILYQVAGRLDVTVLWETVLLAIGIYVTGKITKNQAIVFGILMWVLGTLPVMRTAYMSM